MAMTLISEGGNVKGGGGSTHAQCGSLLLPFPRVCHKRCREEDQVLGTVGVWVSYISMCTACGCSGLRVRAGVCGHPVLSASLERTSWEQTTDLHSFLLFQAGKEALIIDANHGVSFCLESDEGGDPAHFGAWPAECEARRGQSRIWECHSSGK